MAAKPESTMLRAALWYADLGYAVFPCRPGLKQPLTEHGLRDATTDPEQIELWWAQHPQANVAVRTDGLAVIDDDRPDDPWLLDEPDKLGDLTAAPTSLTPRGGRQYLFRQPAGKSWRCSSKLLADRVDTRANGGYIVVPPSEFRGRTYQWLDGHPFDVPPECLPQPPPWLIDALDRLALNASAQRPSAADGNPIPEGQRNATLARLAGAMRRVGMSAAEILAALNCVNTERCRPPLPAREVSQIAASVARYPPDAVSVALVEDHYAQDFAATQGGPLTVRDLLAQCPMLRAPIITGLLRRGETMNVIAPSKTGKSWLVLALAMAVATGRPWLETFKTEQGNVLIIDNELHRETLAHRIPQVAAALNVRMDEIAESICVQSLRGQLRDIMSLGAYFDTLAPERFALIILDAFYRFMPIGGDENDNGTMANIYNRIDAFADRMGCSFVLIHHTTKGNQSMKSVTDVGAGAGSQSRATDTHLVMRPHEEAGAVVLDAAVRSWPPVAPLALRWEFPIWTPAAELDPAALRSERPKRRPKSEDVPPEDQVKDFVERFITAEPRTRSDILLAATQGGYSGRSAQQLLRWAVDLGLAHWWGGGRFRPSAYASVPKQSTHSSGE
jgi:hypothetical protein